MGATRTWAELAAGLRRADLPDEVVAKLRIHTLDQIGAEVAGATRSWNAAVRGYALDSTRPGPAAVVGDERGASAEWAAFANATAGHGFEMDDYHAEALSHPGCVAVPTALAVGEELGATGDEVVVALALGFESILRLGLALMPSMIVDRGFHETCIEGVFGAALAAGRLHGLDAEALASALGIAGSHASGTTEYTQSGGEVKRLHAGLGAMGGIRAVELTRRGFTGPTTILEGARGLLQAFATTPRPEALVDGLGTRWALLNAAIKPYANCGLIHAPIDALKTLVDEAELRADDVEEIVVGCDHLSLMHVGKIGPEPTDTTGAQFSMEFSLAMALLLGGAGFAEYVEAERRGYDLPEVKELAHRIRLELDAEADAAFPERFLARVRVRRRDGTWLEAKAYATGSPDAPMSEEQVRAKFRSTVAAVLDDDRAAATERAVDALFEGGPVRGVLGSLRCRLT